MPRKLPIFKGRSKFSFISGILVELARKNPSLKIGTRNSNKISLADRRAFELKHEKEENSNRG